MDSVQDLLPGLHQLLKTLQPALQSSEGSTEVIEDTCLHLEETDENFHKYEFVKTLRENLEEVMGPIVDNEIEKLTYNSGGNSDSQQETLVQTVIENSINTQGFADLSRNLCNTTTAAVNGILKSFEKERSSNDDDVESKRLRSVFSDGASTCSSSLNQGIFFMSQEQFHCIAGELDRRQPIDVRREALQRLCQVPPSDVMASESWSQLRVSLMGALSDDDAYLSQTALHFHAKMFTVRNYQISRETYICLSEHLLSLFQAKSSLPLLSETLDITEPKMVQLLKRIRLLNEFQCEIPLIWLRYPESFLEVVVDRTLELLSVDLDTRGSQKRLSALQLLTLLDTQAHWFQRWMHGNYSRAAIIKTLKTKYSILVKDAVLETVKFCSMYQNIHSHSTMGSSEKRKYYTAQELRYTKFIHSMCLVTQLLYYSGGRSIFPLTIDGNKITIKDLLHTWIKIFTSAKFKPRPFHKSFEASALVGKMLCNLCLSNAFVDDCFHEEVLNDLLTPIRTWQGSHRSSDATMLHVAEILSSLSSTAAGRKLLLSTNLKSNKLSALHTIAVFAHESLKATLSNDIDKAPAYSVIGSFVFVCRQLYNTCQGLLVLLQYQLHKGIASSWKQVHSHRSEGHAEDEQDTDEHSSHTYSSSKHAIVFEESLLDNLLNFAATPKGLLLLHQTGVMNECVTYMHSRYTKKLQVSKCEKFGYGIMATQVASTTPGIKALTNAGFLKAIIREAWIGLEGNADEIRITTPSHSSFNPADRSVQKSFITLVNVMTSYPAAHQIFYKEKTETRSTGYSFREIPSSPLELLDRLVLINSGSKIHALFNYEQAHLFGLRLLTVLSCNLDVWLLLDTQYNVQQVLLDLQKANRTYEGESIIDQLSIQRNHVLVRALTLGGEKERLLPPRELSLSDYVWPLFYNLPVPKDYGITIPPAPALKKENALSRFLQKTKNSEKNRSWLDQLRRVYIQVMRSSSEVMRGNLLIEVLEKSLTAQEKLSEENVFKKFPNSPYVKDTATKAQILSAGIKMTVRYGKQINALKTNVEQATSNLTATVQACTQLLNQQQTYSNTLKILLEPYPCYDWLVSTVFLMMGGNKSKTVSFLTKLSQLLVSGYLWPARLHASVHLSDEIRLSGIPPIYFGTGHHIELILQAELPLIHSAFRMSGYTPSQIAQQWLTQCFWNYLPWTQIVHYVTTVVVMGADYQVYFCVSVLKHLQKKILKCRQTQDLQVFLKENYVEGYIVCDWLSYMLTLEEKYRKTVLPNMRNISRSST